MSLVWQSVLLFGSKALYISVSCLRRGTFLFRQESTQRGGIGEGLSDALPRTNRPSPMYPTCALSMVQTCIFFFARCVLWDTVVLFNYMETGSFNLSKFVQCFDPKYNVSKQKQYDSLSGGLPPS